MKTIMTHSAEETFAIGRRLGEMASPGLVITLDGDLGAGKTVLAKGVAAGLGITQTVSSPTFTILQIYEGGRLTLYHYDVYRIGDEEEMFETGWEDAVYGEGVCLIEWADLIPGLIEEIPDTSRLAVRIERAGGEDFESRKLTFAGGSGLAEEL